MLNSEGSISSRVSLLLASAASMIGLGASAVLNTAPDAYSSNITRGRMRWPNSERVKAENGNYYRTDTNTPHGVPGAKLARKAAECRLGRYSGKSLRTVARALSPK